MGVIVELRISESLGVKSNGVDFTRICNNRQNYSKSIVRGIGFHNKRFIGNPTSKDRGRSESGFQSIER